MSLRLSKNALLWLLVFSQFAGTSLWFAANAVVDKLPAATAGSFAALLSAVQFGFVAGTLLFSLFSVADRFSSTFVFFASSLLAAASNLFVLWAATDFSWLISLRFITGFFLAGIYPVGMKIAADVFPERLGKALGFLVGALVLGTAFPHLVRSINGALNWKTVMLFASFLAVGGGFLVFFFFPATKNSPPGGRVNFLSAFSAFRSKPFRAAAFGYFGHMWELYALWAILPTLFTAYNTRHGPSFTVALWSFIIIAVGSAGCAVGGLLSQKRGSKPVAFYSLLFSGLCALGAPLFFHSEAPLFLSLMALWGFTITADSPQFSALVARFAKAENKGTALTLVTCLGFSVTVFSIQLLKGLFTQYGAYSLWILSLGPLSGLLALKKPT